MEVDCIETTKFTGIGWLCLKQDGRNQETSEIGHRPTVDSRWLTDESFLAKVQECFASGALLLTAALSCVQLSEDKRTSDGKCNNRNTLFFLFCVHCYSFSIHNLQMRQAEYQIEGHGVKARSFPPTTRYICYNIHKKGRRTRPYGFVSTA